MDKAKIALIAALAFTAGTGAGTAISQPTRPTTELVNIKMTRGEPTDAGVSQWSARACGYDVIDNKRTGEPCWSATLSGPALDALERQLIDARSK